MKNELTNPKGRNNKVQKLFKLILNKNERNIKMKTIKAISGFMLLIIASLLIGCSDNMIAPTNSSLSADPTNVKNLQTSEDLISQDVQFTRSYKVKPNELLMLNSQTTGLSGIRSYKISNCNIKKNELFISSSYIDPPGGLGCSWNSNSNFLLGDLVIENTSEQTKEIEVYLTGLAGKRE